MNLKDNRTCSSIKNNEKFRFCRKNKVVGIGWADYDEDKISDIGFKKADNAIKQFNCGDLVWVRDIESDVYYICEITESVKKREEYDYKSHDLGKCCKCEFFRVGQKLPDNIIRSDLVSRSTIQRANEEVACKTMDLFKKLKKRNNAISLLGVVLLLITPVILYIISNHQSITFNPSSYDSTSQDQSSYEVESGYYIEGTFTEEFYKSEWLKIQCVFAKNGLKAIDPELVKKYNSALKNKLGFAHAEMHACKNNEDESPSLQITVKRAPYISLEKLSDGFKNDMDSALRRGISSDLSVKIKWKPKTTYDLLGEEYLLQGVVTEISYGNAESRESTFWFLHRIKDGCFVTISCSGVRDISDLQELLKCFEPLN